MLTRLVHFQLGRSSPASRAADLDPRLVSDLRIAENVMGTIVGAIAGQEEATCRVIDSLIRLKPASIEPRAAPNPRYGSFAEATALAAQRAERLVEESRRAVQIPSWRRSGCSRRAKCCSASAPRRRAHRRQPADRRRARSCSRRTGRR